MVQKIGVPNSGPYVKRFQIREFLSKCSILEPSLIYHISLCKYYTGPLDPGIFGHDRSKKPSLLNNLLFLQAGPQIFCPSVAPITNLNIYILKTDAVKKTPNTVVMHYFLFYCISLYTHYTYIKVQCIKNMYNKNCSEMNTVAYRKIY